MGYIENGTEIAKKLNEQYGWARNPIVAYLANAQQESNLNPASFQSGQGNWNSGVGLNQWTPGTNLQTRARAIGRTDYLTIDCQLAVTDYERRTGIQYYATSAYNISFNDFIKSSRDIEWLTYAWEANYERAGTPMMENRLRYAREWDTRIDGILKNIVEEAVQWAIDTANDSSHGYDQGNRWGPDYACSSFLTTAYRKAGLSIGGGTAVNTANMRSYFMAAGFQDVTSQVNFRSGSGIIRGDVLITGQKGHTAMSIGDGQVVQASINEFGGTVGGQTGDQTGQEIWVTRYYNYPWGYCLRYPGGGSVTPPEPKNVAFVRWIPA